MPLSTLAAALVSLAKALPAVAQLADQFAAAWAEHRRTKAHARIDAAIASAQGAPWECPAACPHRLQHAQPAAEPGGQSAGAS